jgi:hypothetical protein
VDQPNTDQLNDPGSGWVQLDPLAEAGAYVSVFYSSPLARWPVRDIPRLKDNKSDPNLETMTYGLFSTCEPVMRGSIVDRRIGEIFFITNREDQGRVLVGSYQLGWHRPGPLSGASKDYVLAAKTARFIDPIRLGDIAGAAGVALRNWFRCFKIIDPPEAEQLRGIINSAPDRTDRYLEEITRLERQSEKVTGFRYPTWERTAPFTWDGADSYLDVADGDGEKVRNSSGSGRWRCLQCEQTISNSARLKLCPHCHAVGTLRPVS